MVVVTDNNRNFKHNNNLLSNWDNFFFPTVLVFVQKSHETSTNIYTCVIFDPTAVIVSPNKRLISSAIWKFMACTSPRKTCNLATGMTRSWHDFGDRQNLLSDHECLSLEPHGEAWKLCRRYNSNTRLRHYQFSFGNISINRNSTNAQHQRCIAREKNMVIHVPKRCARIL